MKKLLRSFAALGLLFAMEAQAHGPGVSRYRVDEVHAPGSLKAGCLDGFAAGASIQRINDFSVVNGNFTCYTQVDPTTSTFQARNAPFVAAAWFGALELPRPPAPGAAFGASINNRGEIFGFESVGNGIAGTRWTLAGGHEHFFFDPACNSIQVSSAVDGNGRYVVGSGLRADSRLPPPLDTFCLRLTWLIRAANGVEAAGPLDGAPAAINAFNVAVGTADRSAIRYDVPTAQVRMLHAADATHSAEATDINDLGDVVGRISVNTSTPGFVNECDRGVAVRWDRDGRENLLPHLPGAVASRAHGLGYAGETVGDSGAGTYCQVKDGSGERATLWLNGRAFDLNTLIPGSAGITLTYAISVNRRGQISAGGFDNAEPLTQCPTVAADPAGGPPTFTVVPCHNNHMYVLTPVGNH
jgi:hypothetical protein